MQMRGPANPYIGMVEPVAQLPGGQGGPAAQLPGDRPQGPVCDFFSPCCVAFKPLLPGCRAARSRPPGSRAAEVYFCKFPNRKYIFVKMEIKNIEIKKPRRARAWWRWDLGLFERMTGRAKREGLRARCVQGRNVTARPVVDFCSDTFTLTGALLFFLLRELCCLRS